MTFLMNVSDSGRKMRKYFHHKCLIKHKEKQKFIDEEKKRLDDLVKFVGSIHNIPKNESGVPLLPRQWYHWIQDLRNGTNRYTKGFKIQKQYKKGVGYDVLEEAYKLSRDGIQWAKMSKKFKDTLGEIRYGLAIVCNKIPDAVRSIERKDHEEKIAKIREEQLIKEMKESDNREVKLNKDRASYDISDFID